MSLNRSAPYNKSVKMMGSNKDSLSSDGGALIGRALIDATHIVIRLVVTLIDFRTGARVQYSLQELLTQWLILFMQGWSSQRDAKNLRNDPAVRVGASMKRGPATYTDGPGTSFGAHGRQHGSAYNGYYKRRVYQGLLAVVGDTGDMLGLPFTQVS